MRLRFIAAGAGLLALLAPLALLPATAASASHDGFHVSGGRLLDANGDGVVLQGVNHLHARYPSDTGALADISERGADSARVVLSSGHTGPATTESEVAGIVDLCKENDLICVLTVQDTVGFGEDPDAASLIQAAEYWSSIQGALHGAETHVIINIGSAPWGDVAPQGWIEYTSLALSLMRGAGFTHTLMVDAPNWGEDVQGVMRENAPQIAAADPHANTVFSVHMYGAYDSPEPIVGYLEAFVGMGQPLVVSEFSPRGGTGADVETVMATAGSLGIGYIGATWSSRSFGEPITSDDMVRAFDPARPTKWGEQFFSHLPGPSSGCTAEYAIVTIWAVGGSAGFQGEVTVTAGASPITGWLVTWSYANGETLTNWWAADITVTGADIEAEDVGWNGQLDPGESTTFGFLATWDGVTTAYQPTCTPI